MRFFEENGVALKVEDHGVSSQKLINPKKSSML